MYVAKEWGAMLSPDASIGDTNIHSSATLTWLQIRRIGEAREYPTYKEVNPTKTA